VPVISADQQQSLLRALLATGRLSSARLLGPDELAWGKSRQIAAAVEGNIDIEGRDVTLRVGLCPRFPLTLPDIFVVLPDVLGTIPHIERDGRVCYRPDEGLLIDYRVPLQVLEEAIEMAVETIAAGISGVNAADFLDELEAYWRQLTEEDAVQCYVDPDDTLRRVDVGRPRRNRPTLVADSFAKVQAFRGDPRLEPPPLFAAHYVPLRTSVLEERFRPRDFESLEWTRHLVSTHLSAENRKELERLGARNYPRALVVLGVPRPKGGKTLVGLDYEGVTGGSPLRHGAPRRPARYVALQRRDRAVIAARAEGALAMSTRRIGLVGCGSVGGYLALQLARAGVGHLTLIDPDKLTAQNAFRHVLGSSAIGTPKVDAMKRELTAKVPYVDVALHRTRIEEALQSREIDIGKLDLLIYAAGDPTVGLYVNEQLHGVSDAPALLFTWLEPYGIGGHALLTKTHGEDARGCFGCLFDSPIDGETRHNRADFAEPGQYFAKDVSGCATMYTPYADLDAARTAELAARLALDFLRGRSVGHPLLSWKGDSEAFRAAGFRTSARYGLDEKALHEQRFSYARETCTACRREP
jgi:molybdopterin-synthase adenylyltransferase